MATTDIQSIINRAAKRAEEAAKAKAQKAAETKRTYLKANTEGICTIAFVDLKPTKSDGPVFVLDVRVDTSVPTLPGTEPDELGAIRNNPVFVDKFDGAGYDEMNSILAAAINDDFSESTAEEIAEAINDAKSKEQPLRGVKLRYEVGPLKKSKSTGNFYSIAKFFPVPDQKPADVKANRETVKL